MTCCAIRWTTWSTWGSRVVQSERTKIGIVERSVALNLTIYAPT